MLCDSGRRRTSCCAVVYSLDNNALCGIKYGEGTYTTEGITALCEALKRSSVTSPHCAASHELGMRI